MYVFRELTDLSYPAIAREFGGRDHTTVIHAVEKISTPDEGAPPDLRPGHRAHPDDPGRGVTDLRAVDRRRGTTCGRRRVTRRPPVGQPRRHPPGRARDPSTPCGTLGITVGQPTPRLTRHDPGSSTIHSPYYHYFDLRCIQDDGESESSVKFRCERDVLVEALGTAGRAVASSGQRPAGAVRASGSSCTGDQLQLTGSDLDLTIPVEVDVSAASGDGVAVLPGRAGVRHRAGPAAGRGRRRGRRRRGPHLVGPLAVLRCASCPADEFPRLPEPTGDAVTLDAGELAEALRQVVRGRASDDARPILTGVLMAAEGDGLRLVATDSYRLAVRDLPGTVGAARGPARARAVAGAGRAGPAARRRPRRSRCASASATPPSRSATPGSPPGSSRASSRTTAG